METKTVAVDPEAYSLLKRAKHEGESFSDAVKHLAGKRRSMLELAGSWSDVPDSDLPERRAKRRKSERSRAEQFMKGWR